MNEPGNAIGSSIDKKLEPENGSPVNWLQQYGLEPSDLQEVESISKKIDHNNLSTIQDFGLEISQTM